MVTFCCHWCDKSKTEVKFICKNCEKIRIEHEEKLKDEISELNKKVGVWEMTGKHAVKTLIESEEKAEGLEKEIYNMKKQMAFLKSQLKEARLEKAKEKP